MAVLKKNRYLKHLRTFSLVLSPVLVPSGLWAQGTAYTGTVRDLQGKAVSGANVAICNYPASLGTTPCSPLESLYSDAALTQSMSNPALSDNNGNYTFFAAPGTYVIQIYGSGIPTETLTVTLPSPANRIAGVYRVGSHTYPCTASGINTAISAAIANSSGTFRGGIVDARACSGDLTMDAPIKVGDNSADPITLLLPTGAVWTFTVSGSNVCDIEQYPQTAVKGPPEGGGGLVGRMQIQSGAGASPYANYCTSSAIGDGPNYSNYHASGFLVYNPNATTTTSGYAAVIKDVADNSIFSNIEVADHTNNGFLVAHACCGASFYNLTAGEGNTGGVPLTVGDGIEADADHDINFFGGSFDDARPGDNQILFNEPPYVGGPINFYGTYSEGNSASPDTAPFIETGPNGVAHGLNFYGLTIFPIKIENVFGIHIPSSQHIRLYVSGMYMARLDPNAIQDERHGVTITVPDNYGIVPTYDSKGFVTSSGVTGTVPVSAEKGTVTLASGSGSVSLSFNNTPICTATDTTAANPVQASASAKALTLTGTGSDVISYICIGNPN